MPKAVEDAVVEISNLAREIKFFDLPTYIFATRALEMELLKIIEARDPEDVQTVLNVTRLIDSTILNALRHLYPFLLLLEAKEGLQAGERVLKLITGIEMMQVELDRLILNDAINGRMDEVYDELLKMLIRGMLVSDEDLLKPRK
ncbi:MAG: hypothetical protein H0Z19_11885 [Archaeoglobus sp.]|uniref:hypothetical protein n=1 Tax=Archaeoglobus sp. TaxID=1872626 RepID=UPI001E19D671|nr:hypothetical protein [Archaeoglobus sp.]MBO8181149.1 hypothetical protein [Archaeoglobus sp.]